MSDTPETETIFPHGPLLSDFLDDLLGLFEISDEGLTFDAEMVQTLATALYEGKVKAEALENFARAYMACDKGVLLCEHASHEDLRVLRRAAVLLEHPVLFPALHSVLFAPPEKGGAA